MSGLKRAMIEVDRALVNLKNEILYKNTNMRDDEILVVLKMFNTRHYDIMKSVKYLRRCKDELCKKTQQDTI